MNWGETPPSSTGQVVRIGSWRGTVKGALAHGETLKVIGCVIHAVSSKLGTPSGHEHEVRLVLQTLENSPMPALAATARKAARWLADTESRNFRAALEEILPFNFQ